MCRFAYLDLMVSRSIYFLSFQPIPGWCWRLVTGGGLTSFSLIVKSFFIGRVRLFWLVGVGCSGAAKIVNSPLSAPSPQSVGDGTMNFAIPYGLSFVPAGAVFSQKEK